MPRMFDLHPGSRPLLISVPHCGTYIPPDLAARATKAALQVPDTDWHVDRLYRFATAIGASLLTATHSRYVIDLNRDPSGTVLYPGLSNTELCPLSRGDFAPIWQVGEAPGPAEIAARTAAFWRPYHDALAAELTRLQAITGRVVLLDAHSIRSVLPRFFDGTLPALNIGFADGTSADPAVRAIARRVLDEAGGLYDGVIDGRFKGGYITRAHGAPATGRHALQLELTWACYMVTEDPPYAFHPDKAERLRATVLAPLIDGLLAWAEDPAA